MDISPARPGIDPGAFVSPAAHVSPGARIAAGCHIGPGCVIGPEVELAENVWLHSHVVLDGLVRLGAGVRIYPFASVGLPPQDLKYRNEPTGVMIGANTQIREHATIHRGSSGGDGWTRIGANCLIMCVAHVGHDCRLGDGVILVNNVMLAGHVDIGDFCFLQGGSAVQQFIRIGRMSLVSGTSGVERDVLPFSRVKGHRAALQGLNAIGMRRRLNLGGGAVMAVKNALVALHEGGQPRRNIDVVAERYAGNDQVAEIIAFARETFARRKPLNQLVPFRRHREDDGDAA